MCEKIQKVSKKCRISDFWLTNRDFTCAGCRSYMYMQSYCSIGTSRAQIAHCTNGIAQIILYRYFTSWAMPSVLRLVIGLVSLSASHAGLLKLRNLRLRKAHAWRRDKFIYRPLQTGVYLCGSRQQHCQKCAGVRLSVHAPIRQSYTITSHDLNPSVLLSSRVYIDLSVLHT